jgi:hypothetical protein
LTLNTGMAKEPTRRGPRFQGGQVLVETGGRLRVWTFTGSELRPAGVLEHPADQPLPARSVAKGWREWFRPRVDVLWLDDQDVFVQLVELPTDDPSEVPAMLELQMEKLSPLPVGQVVWAHEALSGKQGNGLPVLLLVARRDSLENQLSAWERRGCWVDRVETPWLPLVAETSFDRDGAHVLVMRGGVGRNCLLGWVSGGVLRTLNRVNLADDDRWLRQLVDELNRVRWAGELEGWASGLPVVRLVADDEVLASWSGPLEQALGVRVETRVLPSDAALAGSSAQRAARRGHRAANLLPPEHRLRYRQQFTDRLWMSGLGAMLGIYLLGLLGYFGAVEFRRFQQSRLADELAALNAPYTETLRVKAQAQVLQETVNLRYAALDAWLATVRVMPEEMTLENLTFSGGQSMVVNGNVPNSPDAQERITQFWQALQGVRVGSTNLFAEVVLRPTTTRIVQGVPQVQWSFTGRLQRPEL